MKMMRILKSLPGKMWEFIKRRWLMLLIVLAIVAGIGYWQYNKIQAAKPNLEFTKPVVENLTKTLQVSGVVDAKEKATMRFAAGGKVVYLGAKTGDTVKKGQTIATIDRRELQKRLQQDLNSYMRERWDWENTQDDTDYHVETLKDRRSIDKEQWDLTDTVLNVEIRDIAIQNTVLSAPFAGILVGMPTTVTGVNLGATDAFELVNPTTLIFKAAIDEADIGQVKLGQPTEIELDAYEDQKVSGYTSEIALRSSQSSSGTVFIVEIPILEADLTRYRIGMNGDATITLDTRINVMTVPLDVTRQRDGKYYVDVRTGEFTYEEREIQVGMETDDKVEVLSGVKLEEEILVP